jgi:hypothetical protein
MPPLAMALKSRSSRWSGSRVTREKSSKASIVGMIVGTGPVPCALIRAATSWISGVAMRSAFFPGVLIQLIHLKRRAGHPPIRRGLIQVGLYPLA